MNGNSTLLSDSHAYQMAIESSSDHIVITDVDGKIVYANKAAQNITGYSLDEMISKTPRLWGGLMDDAFYKRLWDTLKNKRQPFNVELKNKRKNGEIYNAILRAAPILDEKQEVVGFIATEEDITERIRVDQAKSEFVSLASHQLRTPLTVIRWYAEMLGASNPLTDEQKGYINQIQEANKRVISLVSALLNVSRIELGTFFVQPVPINLPLIAEQVTKELAPLFEQKAITVTNMFDSATNNFLGDENLLRIIFHNLLTNACKYTPARGKVTVTIEKKDQNVHIRVSDTGVGIPDDAKPYIFTKLFRADNVKEIDETGNGLGLYIVKSVVEAGGGTIVFESAEGKGSTFSVTFPATGMSKKEGTRSLIKGGTV